MIPTTVSNSPSTGTPSISGNSGSSNGHSNGQQQNASSVMIGIASLILEGRAVAEEDFHSAPQAPRVHSANTDTLTHAIGGGGVGGAIAAGVSSSSGSGSGSGSSCCGRQSPKPSTSRAAMSVASSGHVNITTNPHAFVYNALPIYIDPHNNSSSASCSSAESTHQRWTQKLCQLRQASPAASLGHAYEQKVAVEASNSTSGEPELVALAINESGSERGDFEIVRRSIFSHRPSLSNAMASSTSPSASLTSDNFLHSLQSLATTCLRGGSPSAETNYRYSALASPQLVSPVLAATSPNSSYRATTPRFYNPYATDLPGSGSSSGSGIQSPKSLWSPSSSSNNDAAMASCNAREKLLRQSTRRIPIPSTVVGSSHMTPAVAAMSNCVASSMAAAAACTQKSTPKGASVASSFKKQPQRGPHCDQFLKKMGLLQSQNVDVEDHICDMSYVNITCSRWRAYCLKIEAIVARGEPICIEVYLGPVGHKILLEQWIITQKEKVPPPTMTLPSLCSAIRSQLYFSQISAWCDVITKGDTATYDSGRIIFPATTGAAGDLATSTMAASSSTSVTANVTPGSSPSPTSSPLNQSTSHVMQQGQKPRLNIFYRIKPFDSTACFNSMPNVHNFPNVNISENFSISVCLKSLPRLTGGIPRISIGMLSSISTGDGAANEAVGANNHGMEGVSESLERRTVTPSSTSGLLTPADTPRTSRFMGTALAAAATGKYSKSARTRAPQPSIERASMDASNGMHRCTFFIGDDKLAVDEADGGDEEDNGSDFANGTGESSNSSNANLSHREKQLMKYRKRMLKRDKKHRKPQSTSELARFELRSQKCDNRRNCSSELCQPMEQGDEEPHISVRRRSGLIEMISTGTQTQITCCQQCGSEKALVCLRCNNNIGGDTIDCAPTDMDDMYNSSSSLNSSDIIRSPRNKAEMLLQAIQRTPKAAKHKNQMSRCAPICNASHVQNNNHMSEAVGVGAAPGMGCQVCKRQKTQHDFNAHTEKAVAAAAVAAAAATAEGNMGVQECPAQSEEEDESGGKALDDGKSSAPSLTESEQSHVMEEESFLTSTKLTPQIDRCTLSSNSLHDLEHGSTANGSTVEEFDQMACCGFKTLISDQQQLLNKQPQSFQPKPNLLKISCNYLPGAGGDGPTMTSKNNAAAVTPPSALNAGTLHSQHSSLLGRKGLPKVNLTPIFCNPATSITSSLSSPIPINYSAEQGAFSFDPPLTSRSTLTQQHSSALSAGATVDCNIPVQKSYSAPTLPNSPSLSPRFAKQAAIYKRRSRHLSDRSDRSSLGSDEQFSDEELDTGGICSPATSPMKTRSRIAAAFGRMPLLGNLEESLLQKRLVPKVQVMGFKVLLGASGGFCPTQLTIPAAAYFYELRGETLSTPYVCEIRLPRKGYSVPRVGTVQATLLNPMGTVVRMFVIPYDMRDMPPLHQTFIRQRILAEASTNEVIATASSNNIHHSSVKSSSTKENMAFANGYSVGSNNQLTHADNNGSISNSSSSGNGSSSSGNGSSNKYRLSPNGGLHGESCLGHFISAEHMKRLRYSIHLRFQTSRSGRLSLHTDIRLLISRRTDCDTAAAHAKGVLEAPNDLVTDTVMPSNPKYSARQESTNGSKI